MTMTDQDNFPSPHPTVFTKPFWDACRNHELTVQACENCGHLFLPGGPVCPNCWSNELHLQRVSGLGEVFSFAIYRRTYHKAIPAPYVVALIELREGPRLISNIIGCSLDEVSIGMPVRVVFEAEGDFILPKFAPLHAAPASEV